jgi:LysR family transcriptional regulator, regulator for bpeEF and oprC
MDKLRALQYFVTAAEEKSLSGAARRFEVSTTAVAKMITGLEKSIGVRLFDRTAHGLALTATGEEYLESCGPALGQLELADELVRSSTERTAGTIVVGVQHVIASEFLTPALPRFHALHPHIEIDVRDFNRVTKEQTRGVDVFLVLGWPDAPDLIRRQIAAARFIIVAAPSYWKMHGTPRDPRELEQHICLPIRGVDGTVMDLWTFARGDERVSVNARGWLITSNTHRDMAIDLALAGQGVARILDWTNRRDLASGALVQVLADWESPEAPPVNLLYRPSVRRVPRVRMFMNFVVEVFRELEATRTLRVVPSARPLWLRRPYGRASASVRRQQ